MYNQKKQVYRNIDSIFKDIIFGINNENNFVYMNPNVDENKEQLKELRKMYYEKEFRDE